MQARAKQLLSANRPNPNFSAREKYPFTRHPASSPIHSPFFSPTPSEPAPLPSIQTSAAAPQHRGLLQSNPPPPAAVHPGAPLLQSTSPSRRPCTAVQPPAACFGGGGSIPRHCRLHPTPPSPFQERPPPLAAPFEASAV
jgi:hypothetical protein